MNLNSHNMYVKDVLRARTMNRKDAIIICFASCSLSSASVTVYEAGRLLAIYSVSCEVESNIVPSRTSSCDVGITLPIF